MKKFKIKFQSTSKMSWYLKEELWNVYYPEHNISKDEFFSRIENKLDEVAIFYLKKTNQIVGMSGFRQKIFTEKTGRKIATLYTGLSFIQKKYRGNGLVLRSSVKRVISLKLKHPFMKLIFWDDTISIESYLIYANYVYEYYPRLNTETPNFLDNIIDLLGEHYYPNQYDHDTMCVVKDKSLLNYNLKAIEHSAKKNEYIKFFITKNRDYYQGNGLITVAPISFKNVFLPWKKSISKKYKLKRIKAHEEKRIQQQNILLNLRKFYNKQPKSIHLEEELMNYNIVN